MLTLDNFESEAEEAICQRGKSYFSAGAILSLEETSAGEWQAEVEGQETYLIDLSLDKRVVTAYACDCPYDGILCKHVVAVLYALHAASTPPPARRGRKPASPPIVEQIKEAGSFAKPRKRGASKKITLEELVAKLSPEELRAFVLEQARQDKSLGTKLQVQFSDKDPQVNIEQKFTTLIRQAIRQHSQRGFVDYRASSLLARQIDDITATGWRMREVGNYPGAAAVGMVVVAQTAPALATADDSNGSLGESINLATQLLLDVARNPRAEPGTLTELFAWVSQELKNPVYSDYGDFDSDLLDVAQAIGVRQGDTANFLKLLDQLANQSKSSYRRDAYVVRKIAFLKATRQHAEADRLVVKHLNISQVRSDLVAECIEKKDLARAKKLLNEGIELAQKENYPGLVHQWQRKLLDIATLEDDLPTVRRFAQVFAFEQGFDERYYQQWKGTYPAKEWPAVVDAWIEQKTQETFAQPRSSPWGNPKNRLFYAIAPVLIAEKYWNQLLELTQQAPDLTYLEIAHQHLVARYPQEMLAMYLPLIRQLAAAAAGRPDYAKVAKTLKKVKKDIPDGKEAVGQLVDELRAAYPRRPAMLEELAAV